MKQRFRIAARAMRQLGAELITSDDVALNELIKNAFDAGSKRVTVALYAPADAEALSLLEEELRRKTPPKLQVAMERLEKSISDGLSIQRRADLIALFRSNTSDPNVLADFINEFRAKQFYIEVKDSGIGMSPSDLADNFLVIGTPNKFISKKDAKAGDKAILGDKGIGRLSMMRLGNLATVRSKKLAEDRWHDVFFEWDKFDNPNMFLDEIDISVQEGDEASTTQSGTEISIRELSAHWSTEKVQGFIDKYLRRLQDPFENDRQPYPIDVLLNGKRQHITSIPPWLEKSAQFRAEISFDPEAGETEPVLRRSLQWRGSETSEIRTWSTRELTTQLGIPFATFKRLGPFTASCFWFNRQLLTTTDIEKTRKDVTDELNLWCGGFSVYRDGFRVGQTGGMDDDWLEWDGRALKTKGFTLNRYQTVGSVSITSKKNPYLIDAANRERLVSCPEQLLLKRILGEVIVMDFRSHIDATKQAQAKISIAEESTEESLRRSEDSLNKTIRNIEEIGRELPKDQRSKITEIKETLQGQVEYLKTIKAALQMSQETRVELLELANIGLVVEIVIHELSRLTERTGELLVDLQNKKTGSGADIVHVIDNLQTQIKATNKRIRSVDVMSPAGRHRKENYDAVKQTLTIVGGFANRFRRHDIEYAVTLDGGEPNRSLEVYMVRGLISQALENLLTNSVYWLQQGVKPGIDQREIAVDIDSKAKTVSISDSGPGVDPAYAKEIFKPYYTTRKKGKGLGLYIASELVEYHGGKLYLDPLPDDDGRLRTFVIELPRD